MEEVPISPKSDARFWFLEVSYNEGAAETYTLPVQISTGESAHVMTQTAPEAVIARFSGSDEAILHDATWDAGFRDQLFQAIAASQTWRGRSGGLLGIPGNSK